MSTDRQPPGQTASQGRGALRRRSPQLVGVTVFLDVDGVLYQYMRSVVEQVSRATGRRIRFSDRRCFDYDPTVCFSLSQQEWLAAHEHLVRSPGAHAATPPVSGSVRAVKRLRRHGADLRLLTARESFTVHHFPGLNGATERRTHEWLAEWLPSPLPEVTFVAEKAPLLADFRQSNPGQRMLLVDDDPQQVQSTIDAGVPALLFDWPYNRHASHLPRLRGGWNGRYVRQVAAAAQPAGTTTLHPG